MPEDTVDSGNNGMGMAEAAAAAHSSSCELSPTHTHRPSSAVLSAQCTAALEKLVQYRITGLPVVDKDFKVVSIVAAVSLALTMSSSRWCTMCTKP